MPKTRILIVEDDVVAASTSQKYLNKMGYTVTSVVSSGEEAIRKTGEDIPDLILMDIILNGDMDGIEAAGKIQDRFDIPVVYLTAYTDDKKLERAKITEPFGYLLKPFKERELYATIEMTLYKHRTEKKLKEHEYRLSIVIEQNPCVIMITDANGSVEYVNPKFTKLTGYTQEDVLGQNCRILKSSRQSEEFYKNLWETISSGEVWTGDFHNRKKDGSLYWEHASISSIRDSKYRITRYIKIGEDISTQKFAEEELMKSQWELEERVAERTRELEDSQERLIHAEKLSAIGKLSASIAHEFNNPIYGILNVLERIERKALLDKENKEFVGMAIRECNRMADLIKKLMDFYRPTSGVSKSTDIHKVIDEMLMLTQKLSINKKIKIEKDFASNMPEIEAIPDQLKQIILNLLTNACEAITENCGRIEISTVHINSKIRITIKDNGIGIPPENLKHIFEPFFTTKSAGKGTGLGLYVSYGIIKRHGGDITVHSKPGQGTQFTVTLPTKGISK